ncbi:hypothetical protein BDZ89DRAFT_1050074, partial [Hymenopellis radicata]
EKSEKPRKISAITSDAKFGRAPLKWKARPQVRTSSRAGHLTLRGKNGGPHEPACSRQCNLSSTVGISDARAVDQQVNGRYTFPLPVNDEPREQMTRKMIIISVFYGTLRLPEPQELPTKPFAIFRVGVHHRPPPPSPIRPRNPPAHHARTTVGVEPIEMDRHVPPSKPRICVNENVILRVAGAVPVDDSVVAAQVLALHSAENVVRVAVREPDASRDNTPRARNERWDSANLAWRWAGREVTDRPVEPVNEEKRNGSLVDVRRGIDSHIAGHGGVAYSYPASQRGAADSPMVIPSPASQERRQTVLNGLSSDGQSHRSRRNELVSQYPAKPQRNMNMPRTISAADKRPGQVILWSYRAQHRRRGGRQSSLDRASHIARTTSPASQERPALNSVSCWDLGLGLATPRIMRSGG